MLLFERLMPDTWWCARGVQVLYVSSFFPEGGFWLSVHIATQFIFYCLSESAWVWTDRLWKPKASGISYFAIRTENVLYPTRCTYATLHVTNGRQRETQKVPSNDVYFWDAQRCCRNSKDFFFFFWKKKKRLKVMRLWDVLQSTLLLRPCSLISCFEDSRFASAAAFRCFSASFLSGLRPQILSTDVSSHFIQLHACNSLIAPYPYYWNVVWSSS